MTFSLHHTLVTGAALVAMTYAAHAADDPHIRGEIRAITGATYSVETASGQSVDVDLAAEHTVLLYTPLALEDVKAEDYLGIPSAPAQGGGKRALAVVVFPEAMRGFNEGEGNWDLVPGSRMINATLAQVTANEDAGTLTVTYDGDSEEIAVPEGTPVVTFAPAPDRKIEIGEQAIFFAQKTDGGFTAGLVGVSEDGSLPPL